MKLQPLMTVAKASSSQPDDAVRLVGVLDGDGSAGYGLIDGAGDRIRLAGTMASFPDIGEAQLAATRAATTGIGAGDVVVSGSIQRAPHGVQLLVSRIAAITPGF